MKNQSSWRSGFLAACALVLCLLASGCATRYTVDDGSPVDEKLLAAIRTYGKAEQTLRPSIIKSAQLKDKDCDKQWELPFVVASSYDLPRMERIAWVRGLQVDERLTIIAATPESGLQPGDKIQRIDGTKDDADELFEKLMDLRDDGDEFTLTLSDLRKVKIKPIEVCRGHVEVTKPKDPNAQDYHWLKSTHAMSIFEQDLTPDEAMWVVLWTQGLSEEAGARMKTYHYGMKVVKTTLTVASIASGVGAAANAASAAAAQYAASEAGKAAAQAAGKELANYAAEQVADAVRKKALEAAIKEIAKATAQEIAVGALRTAAIFKSSLSGISWVAGTGFYMADKWAFDRMARLGADPLAAYTLHYKLASRSQAENAFVFDEERLAGMIKLAEAGGVGAKAKLALAGGDPHAVQVITEGIEAPAALESYAIEETQATEAEASLAEASTATPASEQNAVAEADPGPRPAPEAPTSTVAAQP
ncbi:hypothetical protein [Noviherbaspirillum massiliense]|uniref:hypothetical protein n=1 Tax=Noviherbaspirillum massiliense TaxID=1465823 RepID=UPI0002F4F28C|nr:hypothetical protein [Noviherbaspirillum massiliense]